MSSVLRRSSIPSLPRLLLFQFGIEILFGLINEGAKFLRIDKRIHRGIRLHRRALFIKMEEPRVRPRRKTSQGSVFNLAKLLR